MMSNYLDLLCLVIFVVVIKSQMSCSSAKELRNPSTDFKKYTIFKPIIHHGRTKREISTTKHDSGLHLPEVEIVVSHGVETLVLELRREEDLVAERHALHYQPPGDAGLLVASDEEVEWCHYRGHVRHRAGSWCAVSTCHGVSGVVFDGRNVWYIQPADEDSNITSDHYMYNGRDLTTTHRCGHQHVDNSTDFLHGVMANHHHNKTQAIRHKRDVSENTIHEPYNTNIDSQYVELVLVADNKAYKKLDSNLRKVHSFMIQLANILNALYSPLNIYIALVDVVVWNNHDPIQLNGIDMLEKFMEYRQKTLLLQIPHDNAQLLTGVDFANKTVVGKGYKDSMCSVAYSGGVSNFHSSTIGHIASTMAHEMGHNFGMSHDEDGKCHCPGKNCIMGAYSGAKTGWSDCSKLIIETHRAKDFCLYNNPRRLFKKTCGNGFVEPGEQCDCGVTVSGAMSNTACHVCCDPNTCKLKGNATCGAGNCCDLNSCTLKTAGTKCRSAVKECDLPEYCTGDSEFCPDDVYKMDTTPCRQGAEEAYCVNGACESHASYCRVLYGPSGRNADPVCYTYWNSEGTVPGNCGYDHKRKLYKSCPKKDVHCGHIFCKAKENKIQMRAQSPITTWTNSIRSTLCYTASNDILHGYPDVGLVPDGAKCGHGKMCLNQSCVSVLSVRENIGKTTSVCPSDCSGHGVCDSKGQCHCDAGFAPPLCAVPGLGGSQTSGPATDPAHQTRVMIGIYGFFVCLVLIIVLVIICLYFFHRLPCDGRNEYVLTCCCGDYKKLFTRITYVQKTHRNNIKKLIQNNNHQETNNLEIAVTNNVYTADQLITRKETIDYRHNRIDDPIIYQNVHATNVSETDFSDAKHSKQSNSSSSKASNPVKVNGVGNSSHINPNISLDIKRLKPVKKFGKGDIQIVRNTNQDAVETENLIYTNITLTQRNKYDIVHKPLTQREEDFSREKSHEVLKDKSEVKPQTTLPVQSLEVEDLRKNLRKVNPTNPKSKLDKEEQPKQHIFVKQSKNIKSEADIPLQPHNMDRFRIKLKHNENNTHAQNDNERKCVKPNIVLKPIVSATSTAGHQSAETKQPCVFSDVKLKPVRPKPGSIKVDSSAIENKGLISTTNNNMLNNHNLRNVNRK